MKYSCFFLALLLTLVSSVSVQAQNLQGLGEWKSYLPFNQAVDVAQSENYIYYASNSSVLQLDKETQEQQFLSKVEGLSDAGIRKIHFNKATQSLVIIYDNSNMDIVTENSIYNVADIVQNQNILKSKRINDVLSIGPYIYLAADFGLVQFDVKAQEFGFTFFTENAIHALDYDGSFLYIGGDQTLQRIALAENVNPADQSNWEMLWPNIGTAVVSALKVSGDDIYFIAEDKLWKKQGEVISEVFLGADARVPTSFMEGRDVRVTHHSNYAFASGIYLVESSTDEVQFLCSPLLQKAIKDQYGQYWLVDRTAGFKYQTKEGTCATFEINRPKTRSVSKLLAQNNNLYVAHGGVTYNFGYRYNQDGFSILEDRDWTQFNSQTIEEKLGVDMRDVFDIAYDKRTKTTYFGSFWKGLIALKDGELTLYDASNSALQNSELNPDNNRIAALDFDPKRNLWMANHDALKPLVVKTADDAWQSFTIPDRTNIEQLVADKQGRIWLYVGNRGLHVYDPGSDVLSTTDDRWHSFTTNNCVLPNVGINAMAIDQDGQVWIGTEEGIYVFDCGDDVFEGKCSGFQPLSGGFPLLKNEVITSIAIDGANRKWIGSRRGIFVQEPTGDEEILRFTTKNSALFDDIILDIAIDQSSGVVYVASNKGIQSYRNTATEGVTYVKKDIEVYPNPHKPEHLGPVAINKLAKNAWVKIVSPDGHIVHQSRAIGGQAVWDTKDLNGRPVSSGVYLIYSTDVENEFKANTVAGKVIIIR